MDLTASEQTRFAADVITGNVAVRIAAGLYWRGLTNVDVGTGLAKNIIERWAAQKTDMAAMFTAASNVKAYWNYFSPAPYWKDSSDLANGVLWAGGAYSRATTLESIRLSDPTGYNTQIGLLTDAMLVDTEYFHTNVGCIFIVGLQNEPARLNNFGNLQYPFNGILYHDVALSYYTKVAGSATLATCGGNANTITFTADSWRAPSDSTYKYAEQILTNADTYALMAGGDLMRHEIQTLSDDANDIRVNQSAWNTARLGIGLASDERWNVNECVGTPNLTTGQCSTSGQIQDYRWSNEVLVAFNFIGLTGGKRHNPLIHASIPTTAVGGFATPQGYGWTTWRPPGSPTPSAPWASLSVGEFTNTGNFFWSSSILQRDYIPQNAQIYKMLEPGSPTPSSINQRAIGWKTSGANKIGIGIVNRSSSVFSAKIFLGTTVSLSCNSFNSSSLTPTSMGAISTSAQSLTVTVPIWSAVVCQEQ